MEIVSLAFANTKYFQITWQKQLFVFSCASECFINQSLKLSKSKLGVEYFYSHIITNILSITFVLIMLTKDFKIIAKDP